jgi:hypothetical protein
LQFLRDQEKYFECFTVKNISRNDNSDADELANAAAQNTSLPQDVFLSNLKTGIHQSNTRHSQRNPHNTK